jgi:C1A family cysteine protease
MNALLIIIAHCLAAVDISLEFEHFKLKYSKQYPNQEQTEYRKGIFLQNYNTIQQINSLNYSYQLQINYFSDLTHNEISQYFSSYTPTNHGHSYLGEHQTTLHSELEPLPNWVLQGAVTTPKYQMHCSNCYAFTAISTVESLYAIEHGSLHSFSEQELTDCSAPYGSRGCGGGSENVFDYIADNGIHLDKDYQSFKGYFDNSCLRNNNIPPFFQIKGYMSIKPFDNDALMSALYINPVFVTAYVDHPEFIYYGSGILDIPNCGVLPQHAMTLVGAGSDNGSDYWILKNSWSVYWGDHGYIKIKRESGKSFGMCGLNLYGYYPVSGNNKE